MLKHLFQRPTRKKEEDSGFLALTEENLNIHVPSNPGLYMLAMRLGKDVYYTFHTNQANNLYVTLRRVREEHDGYDPISPRGGIKRVPCYFTFFPFTRSISRCDIEKMFASSIYSDQPIRVINNN